MKTVAFVIYNDVLLLDLSGPAEVFSLANRFLPAEQHYQVVTLAEQATEIRASNGIRLHADYSISQYQGKIDLLLVPGGPGAYRNTFPALYNWLRDYAGSKTHGSICTGAFILGHAGLLDGRRVTTHWNYTQQLAKMFPASTVETDKIVVRDNLLLTSGGITTGIDLALNIVEEDHGHQLAVSVAKVLLVIMKRQGGQVQFSPLLAKMDKDVSPIAQIQEYILAHLHEPLSIEKLAGLANMSVRHFARIFRQQSGITPMAFVLHGRVDQARKLLESTDLPLKTVSYNCGFSSTRQMGNLFNQKLGLSPGQYRRQYR